MTVKDLIALLSKLPQDAECWYIEGTYGDLNTAASEDDITMKNGKVILGYDGTGGGDVD